jgi:hypothetical protein
MFFKMPYNVLKLYFGLPIAIGSFDVCKAGAKVLLVAAGSLLH